MSIFAGFLIFDVEFCQFSAYLDRMDKKETTNVSNTDDVFVSLLTANQRRIFAYIMSLVANVNDADDILQETVQMMLKKFHEFELGTDFLAWGVTIAYYRVLDFRKQKARGHVIFNDEIFNNLENQAKTELHDADEYLSHLKNCINKLPQDDVGLLEQRYVSGMAVKDIAERFGRNVKSVYRSMARIHNLLRLCIKKQLV